MKETEEHSLLRIVVYNIQIFFSLSIWMPTGTCLYGNQSEKYERNSAGNLLHSAAVVLVFLATTSETKQRQISCHFYTQPKYGQRKYYPCRIFLGWGGGVEDTTDGDDEGQ